MISANDLKFAKSLQIKKYRNRYNAFVAEGSKNITEILGTSLKVLHLWCTEQFFAANEGLFEASGISPEITTEKVLKKAGTLQSNNAGFAVLQKPDVPSLHFEDASLILLLDNIDDPGNLGTIWRLADWYGVDYMLCSENTVDVYNPKTISASKGAFTRITPVTGNLEEFLKQIRKNNITVSGASMEGENIHHYSLPEKAALIMGSEAKGIHHSLYPYIDNFLSIPRWGEAESLNVGVATAIILDNLRRS